MLVPVFCGESIVLRCPSVDSVRTTRMQPRDVTVADRVTCQRKTDTLGFHKLSMYVKTKSAAN
jgi:hypothetical protein